MLELETAKKYLTKDDFSNFRHDVRLDYKELKVLFHKTDEKIDNIYIELENIRIS